MTGFQVTPFWVDVYWVAWGLTLAVWARLTIPAFVAVATYQPPTPEHEPRRVKTQAEVGWHSFPSYIFYWNATR